MNNLTITERARLKRNHGITVTRECGGKAFCVDSKGKRCVYSLEYLREGAKPSMAARLWSWLAGGVV